MAAAMAVALAIWAVARLLGVEPTVGKGGGAGTVGAAAVPLIGMHVAVEAVLIAGSGRRAAATG